MHQDVPIQLVDVICSALLSMDTAKHGIFLFVEESVTASTANVDFLPVLDNYDHLIFSRLISG